MCVDAITGASLESRIFPEFHRGLPAHAVAAG
jgi:hypothetical protein